MPDPVRISHKPTVPEILPLANAYYAKPGNGVGGSLHIVLDDGNVDDGSVEFCRKFAMEQGDDDGVALADILLRMSRTQRHKLYRLSGAP
jgi:hypothetical protein